MTYRLDDEGAFDRRRVGAGNEACGAVDRAGQWCAHELTDGVLPHEIAISIAPQKVWSKALLHRLIEELPTGEYRILDYLQWNWSKEKVEAVREASLSRKRKQRHADCHAVTSGVTHSEPAAAVAASGPPSGQGTASGSGSDPEGVQGEPARSEPRLKSVPLPADDPPKSADEIAIALQIRQHAVFRPIDAHGLAATLAMRKELSAKRIDWVLKAIDDCAAKSVGQGLTSEALQHKLVGFCDHARASRVLEQEKPAGAQYREFKSDPPPPLFDASKQAEMAQRVAGLAKIGRGGT